MQRVSKTFAMAVTALSIAVIFVIAFAWVGPGLDGVANPASAALFDEQLVQTIYEETSPAVVDINVDRQMDDAYGRLGFGSGFLIDSEGHIATNFHVVQNADRIRISFQDGSTALGEVLGTNPANDLALVKVDSEAVKNITPLALGDSGEARPGQLAIAIGSPFGLGGSITVGVVSGLDRTLTSDLYRPISGVIQTDALINPGNSGGPLLNRSGEVIGINTAIQSRFGRMGIQSPSQGSIGFAVPASTLDRLRTRLMEKQEIRPPWLGISAATLQPLLVEALELPKDKGIYVTQVMTGSPAAEAGLVPSGMDQHGLPTGGGDIITGINGAPVTTVASLITQLNLHLPGDEVTLQVFRDGEQIDVPLDLGEWPEETESSAPRTAPDPDEWNVPKELLPPGFPSPEGNSDEDKR